MKRQEKSDNVRNAILDVSGRLFVDQGYQKTTIRQIAEEAGIKIGTIYHFFRDKEEVLLKHSQQIDSELMAHVEQVIDDPNDFILKYALYRALEFKIVEKYDKIAELYLESYNSWRMTQMIVPRNMQRKKLFFHEFNAHFTRKDYYRLSLALRGMRQICIAERVHTGMNRFKEHTPFIIETALTFFNVPKPKRDAAVAKAMEIAKDKQGMLYATILGYRGKGRNSGKDR
ncbi:MAG: TetR/AcrR family transcriptional regulator [Syntrophaceae bacterium]|jgi:AcrR family transcriptional regulator|nr:TetR/AcrR family transcriptional regulator [Syntrophaceae bacterium]